MIPAGETRSGRLGKAEHRSQLQLIHEVAEPGFGPEPPTSLPESCYILYTSARSPVHARPGTAFHHSHTQTSRSRPGGADAGRGESQ